jgi:CheY-like chemotaxis protein
MKRLLIIEDDALLGRIYSGKIGGPDLTLKIAATGRQGLDLVQTFRPHALVLDLNLPDVSGMEILKQLRASPDTGALPIVVFTNAFLPGPIKQAQDAGATEVLMKAECSATKLALRLTELLAQSTYNPPAGAAEPPAAPEAAPDPRAALIELAKRLERAINRVMLIPSDLSRTVELTQVLHAVSGVAAVDGQSTLAWMTSAVEALARDLLERPKNMNPSSVATMAAGTQLIIEWLAGRLPVPAQRPADCAILAVDDDPIVCELVKKALLRAQLPCQTITQPKAALDVLREKRFDLVLLDIEMPEMDGMALCRELRAIPLHQKSPVVFVTAVGEFERRQEAGLSGGNDLLAKPFLPMELAVKALTWLLKKSTPAK